MQARCSASNLESLSRWSVYFSRFSNRVKVKCAKKNETVLVAFRNTFVTL